MVLGAQAPGRVGRRRISCRKGHTRVCPFRRSGRLTAARGDTRYGSPIVLDNLAIERLIDGAGYSPEASVAVGVRLPDATVLLARGAGQPLFDCESVAYSGSLSKQLTGAVVLPIRV